MAETGDLVFSLGPWSIVGGRPEELRFLPALWFLQSDSETAHPWRPTVLAVQTEDTDDTLHCTVQNQRLNLCQFHSTR